MKVTNFWTNCVESFLCGDYGDIDAEGDEMEVAAREIVNNNGFSQTTKIEKLRELVLAYNPADECSVFTDLINRSLDEVNWDEVVDMLKED